MKRALTALLVALVALTAIGMSPAARSAEIILKTNIEKDPVTLEPGYISNWPDRTVSQQIFQGLVQFDYNAKPPYPVIPVLAKSFVVSGGGKEIVFELRQRVKFHKNLGEFTSEDVVFSFERHRDPKRASPAMAQFEDVDRIDAVDKYHVKVLLKNASALSFIGNIAWQDAGMIVSKNAYDKFGAAIATNPIGTGPFYLDRWMRADSVVLRKFREYWGPAAKVDQIQLRVIPEETVAVGGLLRNELDVVALTQLGSFAQAKQTKGLDVSLSKAGAGQIVYWINHKVKPMDDIRVRRALAHALDLNAICQRLGETVSCFPSPFSSVVFGATDEFWNYKYDVGEAKRLLTEAGYPNGFDLKLVYKKLHIFEPVALEVKRSWDQVINVQLEANDNATFYGRLKRNDYHIASDRFTRFTPYLYAQFYQTGSPVNYANYSNPETDQIIQGGMSAADETSALRYWRDLQRKLTVDVASFWIVNMNAAVASRSSLRDITVLPMATVLDLSLAQFK